MSEQYIEVIRTMRAANKSFRDIAEALDISLGVVAGIVRRNKIPCPLPKAKAGKVLISPEEQARLLESKVRKQKRVEHTNSALATLHNMNQAPIKHYPAVRARQDFLDDDRIVFDIESREAVWSEFGSAFMSIDDSY